MTKAIKLLINIPFVGFYDSSYSDEIDTAEDQFVEYHCDIHNGETDLDYEAAYPAELRLTARDYGDILTSHTDYSAAYRRVAAWYAAAFDAAMSDAIGFPLGMSFESMDSPREYNFATDRIFAHIPLSSVKRLFARSRRDKHATLSAAIKAHCTSYDGFISHYRNDLASWLDTPVAEWDHNELRVLLEAVATLSGIDEGDLSERLYYDTFGDDAGLQAWEDAVDWPAFEAARDEARQDLRDELGEDAPVIPDPPDPRQLSLPF